MNSRRVLIRVFQPRQLWFIDRSYNSNLAYQAPMIEFGFGLAF